MDPFLFVMQVALPVGLLLWLWLRPMRGGLPLVLQVLATGVALAAIAMVAPFAMPPYWVPWLYGAAWLLLSIRGLARSRRGLWPEGPVVSVALAPVIALGIYGAGQIAEAVPGQRPPEGVEVVDLAAPLPGGLYIVENGGSRQAVNGHMHLLAEPGPDRGQAYAADIIRIRPSGLRTDGWRPADPSRYLGFGTPVVAPCAGEVVAASDTAPDMAVPLADAEHPEGNSVTLDCGGTSVVLAHLRQGSLAVATGDAVEVGAPLGELGNSGNTTEPHLHIHAERDGAPLAITLEGRFLARNDRIRF
ncbi:M23 family metallopeptidase [Pseudoroseicyclus sp. CXY001]|uniref:M23 family metallopeptidase n=1 Tax=Pseudoroseicyclus sp. CXY001 TaxID=3242492 RepID=UPI003570D1FA